MVKQTFNKTSFGFVFCFLQKPAFMYYSGIRRKNFNWVNNKVMWFLRKIGHDCALTNWKRKICVSKYSYSVYPELERLRFKRDVSTGKIFSRVSHGKPSIRFSLFLTNRGSIGPHIDFRFATPWFEKHRYRSLAQLY